MTSQKINYRYSTKGRLQSDAKRVPCVFGICENLNMKFTIVSSKTNFRVRSKMVGS